MSETAGKRIAAFIIDYMILCWVACLTGVLGVFVVASRGVQELAENFQWMMPGMFLYCVLLMGIWFFILDIFGNLDPGKAGEDRVVKQRPEVYRQYGYNAFCIEDALLLYLADIIFVLYR